MSELEKLSKLKRFNKINFICNLIWLFFIIVSPILCFVILISNAVNSATIYNENLSIADKEKIDKLNYTIIIVTLVVVLLATLVIFIISLVYNIRSIKIAYTLNDSVDKTIYIVLSIFSIFFLGFILNLVNLILVNSKIKELKIQLSQKINYI